jgi:staphyloferrin B biosynthesis citrate synthase
MNDSSRQAAVATTDAEELNTQPTARPPTAGAPQSSFRRRLLAGERLVGSFVKTPTSHTIEVLGDLGFDFVVIDEEHGPFDRLAIDHAILGARASGTAPLVRVSDASPARLLAVLDDGAAGVLVPHVASAEKARSVVAACRYRGGERGISNTTRAGRFGGLGLWQHVDVSDATVAVIGMIEDPEAIDEIDSIVAIEGLDAVFIGRGDLTLAYGVESQAAEPVRRATDRVIAAATAFEKPVCVMVGAAAEAASFEERGVHAFIVSSDQGFLRQAAGKALAEFATVPPPKAA